MTTGLSRLSPYPRNQGTDLLVSHFGRLSGHLVTARRLSALSDVRWVYTRQLVERVIYVLSAFVVRAHEQHPSISLIIERCQNSVVAKEMPRTNALENPFAEQPILERFTPSCPKMIEELLVGVSTSAS